MNVPEWQYERLSRSSVRSLREHGMDLTLMSIGKKENEITSESLLHVSPAAPSVKHKKNGAKSVDDSKIATKMSKQKPSAAKKIRSIPETRKAARVPRQKKSKEPSGGSRTKKAPVNVPAKQAVANDDKVYLESLMNLGDKDLLRKLADFARTMDDSSSHPEEIVDLHESKGKSDEETVEFIVEEPSDSEDHENQTHFKQPKKVRDHNSDSNVVQWQEPRILEVGQTVRTTVSVAKDMPNVPVVRLDKVVNRVVELGGRRIHQTVPAQTAEHIDASRLTAAQIKQFEKQGFVLKTMKVSERDAIFSGK